MPRYKVTDPHTGKQLVITGDSEPTEQELEQLFGSSSAPQAPQGGGPTGMGHEPTSWLGGALKGILGNPTLLSAIGGGAGMMLAPEGAPLWLPMLLGGLGAGAGSSAAHGVNAATGYEPADAAADNPLHDAAWGAAGAGLGPGMKAAGSTLRTAGESVSPLLRRGGSGLSAVASLLMGHPNAALLELAMNPELGPTFLEKAGEGLTGGNAVKSLFKSLGLGGEEAAGAAGGVPDTTRYKWSQAKDVPYRAGSGVSGNYSEPLPTDKLEPSSTFWHGDKSFTWDQPRPAPDIGGDASQVASGRSGPLHNYNPPRSPSPQFEPQATRIPQRFKTQLKSTFGDIDVPSDTEPFEPQATRIAPRRPQWTMGDDADLPEVEPTAQPGPQHPAIQVDESSVPSSWRKLIPGLGQTSETGGVQGRGHMLSQDRTIDLVDQLAKENVPGSRVTQMNKYPMPSGDQPLNRAIRQRGHIAQSGAKKLGTILPAALAGLYASQDEQ